MLIRIINGTYGHRPKIMKNGELVESTYVVPTTPKDPPIEVTDEEAERLVKQGVAAYLNPPHHEHESGHAEDAQNLSDETGSEPNEEAADMPDIDDEDIVPDVYTIDMRADELRKAMRERGLTVRVGITKKEMVEALNGNDYPVLQVEDVVE